MKSRRNVVLLSGTAFLFLLLAAFGGGWGAFWVAERLPFDLPFVGVRPGLSPATAAAEGEAAAADEMAVFWEAMQLLDEHFYSQEELPQNDQVTYAAIEGVIAATGDPHTGFMDPERARIVESSLEGEFEGIGATVEMSDEGLVIVSPFPETPAEQAGLLPGDLVIEVDGNPTIGLDIMEAVAMVRGPEGSVVRLTVRREGTPELLQFEVTRGTIVVPIVETRLLTLEGAAPIGYLRLNDFGGNSVPQFREGLQSLLDQGAQRMIVDLRFNPGGYLQASVEITSEFIADGVILSEKGSNGRDTVHEATAGGIATEIPLVVLINEGSASASEIFAGAIRDTGRGTLIGTTTFGKGSVQITRDLSDRSSMRITVARWFTPSGSAIHEVGIEPDIVVEWDPTTRLFLEDIAVAADVTPEGLTVMPLYPSSPAVAAGLQAGDVIVAVDGIDTRTAVGPDLVQLGRGPQGSNATLTVQRPGGAEPLTLVVPRSYVDTLSNGDPQLQAAIDFFLSQ